MIISKHPVILDYPGSEDHPLYTRFKGKKYIGYWKQNKEELGELFWPADFVDLYWDVIEREDVINYLKAGEEFESWRGSSWCRFGCGNEADLGYREFTDGTYVWPEGFVHYIETHFVKPPREFVDHMYDELNKYT